MKIAIASGKGGTGKTTVSLALAESWKANPVLIDCDVEEPNCHLFLKSNITQQKDVNVLIPNFNHELCDGCGVCIKSCKFNALARLGKKVLIFPELCHSCGNCVLSCKKKALYEVPHKIGVLEYRNCEKFVLLSGVMNVGHSMAPPIIRILKEQSKACKNVIFDAPPGTACAFVTTVENCDYVILVTEPTPFGLHDLNLAVLALKKMNIPCGVILNRATTFNDDIIEDYCKNQGVKLLMKIPFSYEIAATYSKGGLLLNAAPELRVEFENLLNSIGANG